MSNRIHKLTKTLAEKLNAKRVTILNEAFDTLHLKDNAKKIQQNTVDAEINFNYPGK